MDIRPVDDADLAVLLTLLNAYMGERKGTRWPGTLEELREAREDGIVQLLVAGDLGRPIAFSAYTMSYDLRTAMAGGEILDLFVSPWERGRGLAARLVMRMAADVQARGGRYLRGQAMQDSDVERLYQRVAVHHPGSNIHVGGRAFRALAALSGATPREIVAKLPDRSWNTED